MKDSTFIEIAKIISLESKCNRKKVGAVLVRDKKIIGTGYNGTPSDTCNECEEENKTKPTVIHAELNAILNATTENLSHSTLYCTLAPCLHCSSLIIQKKIEKVIYLEDYHTDGIEYLLMNGVLVKKFKYV